MEDMYRNYLDVQVKKYLNTLFQQESHKTYEDRVCVEDANVWVKIELDEEDTAQSISENSLKVDECSLDYYSIPQSSSIEPHFDNSVIKSEDESNVFMRSVKEEPDLDISFDENEAGGHNIFTCYHCGRSLVSLDKLRRHIRKTHKFIFKSISLDGINAVMPGSPHYKKQQMTPELNRNTLFYCSFCEYITNTSTNMRDHMTSHIKGQTYVAILEKKIPYQCPFCEFNSPYPENIYLHVKDFHTKIYQCPHCDYSARRSGHLKDHIISVHTKEKPYQCSYCDYSSTRSGNLKVHIMSLHTKEKPHQCPQCDYSAAQSSTLKKHITAVHSKVKPYQCTLCKYSASQSNTIKKHIAAVHNKVKPYQCSLCDYSATQSSTLKRHMAVHTKGKPH